MALITETGSASADSESLASVADADSYFANRGITTWATLSTAEKEQALRRGCDFLGQTYRGRWAGYRVNTVQALDFPRYMMPLSDAVYGGFGVAAYYPSDAVPRELVYANCEAAIRAAAGELIEDLEPQVASEEVGPLKTSYFQGGSRAKKFPAIDKLLQPFLSSGSGVKMVRA